MSIPPEKDVRTRLQEALHRYGYKQVDIARETGVHHSTLSLWLQGKIKGHMVKIEETMEQWLKNLYTNKPRFSKNSLTKMYQVKATGGGDTKTTSAIDFDKKKMVIENDKPEELIPIRIDVEIEGRRFKENVCWNLDEPYMAPENFAKIIAEENNLNPAFEHEISNAIKKSVSVHKKYVPQAPELIKVIELDVRIDNLCLKDKFEWDINDTTNNPEDFALKLCNELGLNNEFMTQIAHSIREQIQAYQKQVMDKKDGFARGMEDFSTMKKSTRSLIESSSGFTNIQIKSNYAPILITEHNYLRNVQQIYTDNTDNINSWEPKIEFLDPNDIRKVQKLEDRKNRYEKRRIR
jgi:SWI/SNF-related matrix-associated actin-dependent regulator of chromatin subfamily B protein 1